MAYKPESEKIMKKEICGLTVEKIENGGIVTVTMTYKKDLPAINGAKCFTREIISGNIATCKITSLKLVAGLPSMVTDELFVPVKSINKDGAYIEICKTHPGCIVEVTEVNKSSGGLYGLPKEVFEMLSVPVYRPASQLASKD